MSQSIVVPTPEKAFMTYNRFVKQLFTKRCENPKLANIYQQSGGFKAFKASYLNKIGFGEYFVALGAQTLSAMQVYHLAKMFTVYGRQSPSTLPTVLAGVARQYQLILPDVAGLLTKGYWQKRFDDCLYR
jgi:hypothetical protein